MNTSLGQLLSSRRFLPFIMTQFFSAFNDNVLRQALIVLIAVSVVGSQINVLNNLSLALYIAPFFLFSALAGQVADKYDKAFLIRVIKMLEVLIMMLAATGFVFNQLGILLLALFLMGAHSTFFGPLKYSIIPQHLADNELVAGNALVELGTFLAILLGSVAGVVMKMGDQSPVVINVGLLMVAILGLLSAWFIPRAKASTPELRIDWNLALETWRILGFAKRVSSVWWCVLGISWFWFLGASYITQLKRFVDTVLHGTDGLYAVLLAVFSVGIGVGSILCERLSKHRVMLWFAPPASMALSLAGVDLFFSPNSLQGQAMTIGGLFGQLAGWRLLADLLCIGIFSGLYIVPLFAYI